MQQNLDNAYALAQDIFQNVLIPVQLNLMLQRGTPVSWSVVEWWWTECLVLWIRWKALCVTGVHVLKNPQQQKNTGKILSKFVTRKFTSRWCPCAQENPYVLHSTSQRFQQCCLLNNSFVCLIHYGPFLSFLGRLLSIVWFTMVLSRPFTQGYLALSDLLGAFLVLWRNLNSDDRFTEHCLIHYGPVLSFQRRLLSTLWFAVVLSHPFKEERWALSDSLWSFLILSRKNI